MACQKKDESNNASDFQKRFGLKILASCPLDYKREEDLLSSRAGMQFDSHLSRGRCQSYSRSRPQRQQQPRRPIGSRLIHRSIPVRVACGVRRRLTEIYWDLVYLNYSCELYRELSCEGPNQYAIQTAENADRAILLWQGCLFAKGVICY